MNFENLNLKLNLPFTENLIEMQISSWCTVDKVYGKEKNELVFFNKESEIIKEAWDKLDENSLSITQFIDRVTDFSQYVRNSYPDECKMTFDYTYK